MNISNNVWYWSPRVRGLGRWYETSIILWLSDQAPRCVQSWWGGYIIHKSKLGTALCSRNCAVLPVGFTKQMFLRSIIYIIGDWCNNFSPRLTWTTISSLMSRSDKEVDSPLLWRWHHQFYSDCPILTPVASVSVTLPIRAEKIGLGFLTVKDYNIILLSVFIRYYWAQIIITMDIKHNLIV